MGYLAIQLPVAATWVTLLYNYLLLPRGLPRYTTTCCCHIGYLAIQLPVAELPRYTTTCCWITSLYNYLLLDYLAIQLPVAGLPCYTTTCCWITLLYNYLLLDYLAIQLPVAGLPCYTTTCCWITSLYNYLLLDYLAIQLRVAASWVTLLYNYLLLDYLARDKKLFSADYSLYNEMFDCVANGHLVSEVRGAVQVAIPSTHCGLHGGDHFLLGLQHKTQYRQGKEVFYLTVHSTHFIYGYMASDIWLRTIQIAIEEICCHHMGLCF